MPLQNSSISRRDSQTLDNRSSISGDIEGRVTTLSSNQITTNQLHGQSKAIYLRVARNSYISNACSDRNEFRVNRDRQRLDLNRNAGQQKVSLLVTPISPSLAVLILSRRSTTSLSVVQHLQDSLERWMGCIQFGKTCPKKFSMHDFDVRRLANLNHRAGNHRSICRLSLLLVPALKEISSKSS